MIRLNGSIFIAGEEVYFEDFEIEIDEDLDIPFDDFDEDYDYDDCEDCYFDELENDDQDQFNENLEELLDVYSEAIGELCCNECIRDALVDFLKSFMEI